MNIKITKATKENISDIAMIEKSCFSTAWTEESIAGSISNESAYFNIAYADNQPAGYMSMQVCCGEGDIIVAERVSYVSLSTTDAAAARVISAEAELYAAIYQRGDQVRLFSQEGDICTLYIDGVFATVDRRCLMLEGDGAFESRAGYTASGAEIFRSLDLRGEVVDSPKTNTELTLLWEFENCYLVSLPDGTLGYIAADKVNDKPVVYSFYGGGGGGSSGGGGGGEWTEPVL